MKIALVHDYLREYGGAERVVEVLHEIFPKAPLFTSFVDWKALGIHADRFRGWNIKTSWAQNWVMKKWHSPLRFLTPWVWKYFDFSDYDVVISSSGWFICRGINTAKPTLHISYIHHPPRNLYGYSTGNLAKHPVVRAYATLINPFLRYYDFHAAQKPGFLIANSKETARRIKKFYRRDSEVVYPPIENKFKVPRQRTGRQSSKFKVQKGEYYLSVGRITGAKHVDLIVETCLKLKKKLIVVGDGGDIENLATNYELRTTNLVEFTGSVSDENLWKYYAGAKALIFAAEDEDFGMVPVEAMAACTPVIAYRSGGVIESVIDGKTGIFFDKLTIESLSKALIHFNNSINRSEKEREKASKACHVQSQKFSKKQFKRKIQGFVKKSMKESND